MIDKEKLRQILNEAEGRRAKARSVVDGEEVPSDRERRRKILEEAGLIKSRGKEAVTTVDVADEDVEVVSAQGGPSYGGEDNGDEAVEPPPLPKDA